MAIPNNSSPEYSRLFTDKLIFQQILIDARNRELDILAGLGFELVTEEMFHNVASKQGTNLDAA